MILRYLNIMPVVVAALALAISGWLAVSASSTVQQTTEPVMVSGPAEVEYAENSEEAVATYTASGVADESVMWSVSGLDGGTFEVAGGVLQFADVPDYEKPSDNGENNVYMVTVTAADTSRTSASIDVTVTVSDVNDPNIVVIMADDAGYEVFSPYGSTQYSTPRLSEIASQGARFDNAFAKPLCTPSRIAIMTGKSNVRSYNDWITMARSTYTFGDLFSDAGYATAIAGKWQLHGKPWGFYSTKQAGEGFDSYCLWDTFLTGGETTSRYWDPTVECDGSLIETDAEDYGPDIFVDFLLDFMETNQRRPFFAYYPMVLPHQPFVEPPDASCGPEESIPQCPYEKMVTRVDHNVGQIYDKLQTLGLLDNTLLLFTADNGTPRSIVSELDGETIYGGKSMTTDGGTRVPLIAHVPGQSEGRVVDDLVDVVDILPTAADAAGIELPSDHTFDGVSFWEQLQGNAGAPREWIYTYYWPQPYKRNQNKPAFHPEIAYARDKVYKLYSTGELFNTAEDRLELYPLPTDDVASAGARNSLQAVLDSMSNRGWSLFLFDRGFGSMPDGGAQRPRLRPVLRAASVDGDELTLSYVGLVRRSPLPPAASFTVLVDGDEVPVSEVRIAAGDASIVTSGITGVTLTLESAVTAGQDVTVSYVPGSNPIVHMSRTGRAGAAPLSDRAVVNTINSPSTGQPGIRGSGFSGNSLLALTGDIMDANGLDNVSYSYQWLLCDHGTDTEIEGADQVGYRLRSIEEGSAIKVRVSFTDDAGHDETLTSPPVTLYKPTALTASVSGDAVVLTWGPPEGFPFLFNYRIFRQRPERGETEPLFYADTGRSQGATYTDRDVAPGARYIYRVQATHYWGLPSLLSGSAEIRTPAGNTPATGVPSISGTLRVGETLTVETTGISDADGLSNATYSYQWRSDDVDIRGATGVSYTLADSDEGKTIKVRVSFTDDADNAETLTSDATAAVAAATVADTLAGFTLVDTSDQSEVVTLTAGASVALDDPASGSYGIRVEVATGAEIGSVRLELSGEKSVSQTENIQPYFLYGDDGTNLNGEGLPVGSYTLSATAYSEDNLGGDELQSLEISFSVVETNTPATGAPSISGTLRVGETLTVETTGISDADGLSNATYSYQWRSDDVDIRGATGVSYTLADSDEGKTIKVRVSFTDDADNAETLTSDATAAVAARPLSLDDFDAGDGQEVLASALVQVGNKGRKNNGHQDRAWYATDTTAWHASGELRDGSLAWNDMTLTRVVYFPDTGVFRFNEADAIHIGASFAAGGVNRELTVWVQTETEAVSFLAKDHILNSGSGWINFETPTGIRSVLGGVSKGDLIIIAVSAPTGS